MPDFLEIERAAAKLRQYLRSATLPETKVLCGLQFAVSLATLPARLQEPYLREFVPLLAQAAAKCRPDEFLPKESAALADFVELLKSHAAGTVNQQDLAVLFRLSELAGQDFLRPDMSAGQNRFGFDNLGEADVDTPKSADPHESQLRCLFVEHHPEFGLEARGRILHLRVKVTAISRKLPDDDVVLRNPLLEPDDSFRQQALQSVAAARQHLLKRYGLPLNKRYRFDFTVDSTGARFTGDSLGVAFAVGAIAALARLEVLRDRLRISNAVAFSGALSPEGKLLPIDSEGLKLKIYRAFHSPIRFLTIPHAHLIDALKYEQELEAEFPGRRLELVGADTLDQVASDPRLVPAQRIPKVVVAGKKIWHARRTVLLEITLLTILIVILASVLASYLDNVPAKVIPRSDGFEVQNRFSRTLWAKKLEGCDSLHSDSRVCWTIADIGWKPGKEVLYGPPTAGACLLSGWWFAYSAEGESLFACNGRVSGVYPTDSIRDDQPDFYEGPWIQDFDINGERVIVSAYNKIYPGRGYLKIWNTSGEVIGWYVLSGTGTIIGDIDIDNEGTKKLYGFAFWNRLNNCIGFFVLPVHGAHGVSPPYWFRDGYDLRHVERGNELRFIAVPLTFDVGELQNQGPRPGSAQLIRLSRDEFRLTSYDFAEGPVQYQVDYYLDRNFRCRQVKLGDNFRKKRAALIEEGKVKDIPNDIYCNMLRDSVRYWINPTDSTYTTEGQLRAQGK